MTESPEQLLLQKTAVKQQEQIMTTVYKIDIVGPTCCVRLDTV
jgi:hypothetical protein